MDLQQHSRHGCEHVDYTQECLGLFPQSASHTVRAGDLSDGDDEAVIGTHGELVGAGLHPVKH